MNLGGLFGDNDTLLWIVVIALIFFVWFNNNDCGCGCNNAGCGCGCGNNSCF